jgi:DNA-binding LacI/PurR family transcriptional regulator
VATIAEVAERAGVGVGTVSRVLNDDPRVADATRSHVLDVIRELEYRPSAIARSLSLGRTHTVGVLVPFLTNPSSVERLRGVVEGLRGSEYDLVLFDVERLERRDEIVARLTDRMRADALLVISLPLRDDEVERFARARVPVVLVDAAHASLPHVVVDDVAGGRLATQHLLDLGHQRIAFVGDTPNAFAFTSSRDRRTGFEAALREAGVGSRPEYVRERPHAPGHARHMVAELLRLREPPTAVFAASDSQACGAIEAAYEAGLDVPGDLSVIGFDDIDAASHRGLSTIRQPLHESGARAAALLLSWLGGAELDVTGETLALELVVRSTTAPPR